MILEASISLCRGHSTACRCPPRPPWASPRFAKSRPRLRGCTEYSSPTPHSIDFLKAVVDSEQTIWGPLKIYECGLSCGCDFALRSEAVGCSARSFPHRTSSRGGDPTSRRSQSWFKVLKALCQFFYILSSLIILWSRSIDTMSCELDFSHWRELISL